MSPRMENNNNNNSVNDNNNYSAFQDNESDYESNSDYDSDEELYFDPDEVSNTRFNIVLCELYCKMHSENVDEQMYYHFLNISRFKKLDMEILNNISDRYNTHYTDLINGLVTYEYSNITPPYSIIRNYNNIVSNNNYIKPQIAENIILESGHSICIIKTIWLRLIQRTWKKIYALRKDVIRKRCSINSLKTRELTGFWPENCRVLHGLYGMMSYLKNE